MRLTAILVAVLASPATWGAPTDADAPLTSAMPIKAGKAAPADGVFLPEQVAIDEAKVCQVWQEVAMREASAIQTEPASWSPTWPMLIIGAIVLATGGFVAGIIIAK